VYAAALLATTPGCSTIRVERAHPTSPFAGWRFSAVRRGQLSPRTEQTLRRWDLDHLYEDNADEAAARLHALACQNYQPDVLFALAEVHFVRGQAAEKDGGPAALAHYYLCAGYAYHFVFDAPPDDPGAAQASVFDPRFRLACDLYNAALAQCIAAAQRVGRLDPRKEMAIPTRDGGTFRLSVTHAGFDCWKAEEFGPLLFCKDFQVTGLANQYRGYGLGVPLIATRAAAAPASPYLPPNASFPVTAFFRFEGSVADLAQSRSGRLEMYNPLAVQAVDVRGHSVPLETDLTTPLGYFLAQSNLEESAYTGFVWGDKIRGQTGLRMLAPYQPGKIPVVLVHGLLSSPLTWAPVVNDLQADPVLRERFQFWYYFYPTGEPYLNAAGDLRRELAQLRQALDPAHKDAALDQMVFAGHSMGGLVSRLLTVEGGDDFWHLVSSTPLDRLKLKDQTRMELRQTFYFHKENCVRRVIFLGTPHHGSQLSPSTLGRLAVKLVHLPRDLVDVTHDLAAENPDLEAALRQRPLPTSVDLLAPDAPALELLSSRPRPPAVCYHSVIGVVPGKKGRLESWLTGEDGPGDGVVPYASAHLDGARSELVVPADHFHVHHHPLAVLEVRRILLEHLQEVDRNNSIVPVAHAAGAPAPAGPAKPPER
jgi:pimeloyl-ACP methyl ester carboxylesterase